MRRENPVSLVEENGYMLINELGGINDKAEKEDAA